MAAKKTPAKPATKKLLKKVATPTTAKRSISSSRKVEGGKQAEHLSIRALAGTGKTTTICWATNGVPAGYKLSAEQSPIIDCIQSEKYTTARFTAFSKAIATELSSRLPENVESSTNHSLGLTTIKETVGKINVDANKTWKLCEDLFGKISDSKNKRETMQQYNELKSIVSICKGTLTCSLPESQEAGHWIGTEQQIADTCAFYSVEAPTKSITKAMELLTESSRRTNWVDFDDMIWLPAIHNFQPEQVDLGIVDECQDLNKSQLWLATHSCKRLVTVGDINQSIFGFAGADPSSIPNIEAFMSSSSRGMKTLPLNETRRCAKAVVAECNRYVPEFVAHPSNPEGLVETVKDTNLVNLLREDFYAKTDLMVLCRTNAPLTRIALQLLKQQVPVYIKGKQFAQSIIGLIKKLSQDSSSVANLLANLEDYENAETIKLSLSTRQDSDQKLVELQDRCIIIRIFCEGCSDTYCVVDKFESLFSDENKKNAICLSSAHRSKGLEADKIYISHPELLPHPKIAAKSEFNSIQETNLAYVAKSRAKHTLIYVESTKDERDVAEAFN